MTEAEMIEDIEKMRDMRKYLNETQDQLDLIEAMKVVNDIAPGVET